jgi:general secretion pathway protein I
LSRREDRRSCAGFTLIEVLVAFAVIAIVLPAIGAVVASTVRGTRGIDDRLAMAGTAETLLNTLPQRNELKAGSTSGSGQGVRWRMDISELPLAAPDEADPSYNWMPLAITIRLEGRSGTTMRVDTVRLVPGPGR